MEYFRSCSISLHEWSKERLIQATHKSHFLGRSNDILGQLSCNIAIIFQDVSEIDNAVVYLIDFNQKKELFTRNLQFLYGGAACMNESSEIQLRDKSMIYQNTLGA